MADEIPVRAVRVLPARARVRFRDGLDLKAIVGLDLSCGIGLT